MAHEERMRIRDEIRDGEKLAVFTGTVTRLELSYAGVVNPDVAFLGRCLFEIDLLFGRLAGVEVHDVLRRPVAGGP
jgi:hypothetical protein